MRGVRGRAVKYFACLCLAVFWAALTFEPLIRKWASLPRWFGSTPGADVDATPDGAAEGSRRVAIYFGDRRVGSLGQRWRREGDRLVTETWARVDLNAVGGGVAQADDPAAPGSCEDPVVVRIEGRVVCRRGALERLRFEASLSKNTEPFLVADANPVSDKIVMRIRAGGVTVHREAPIEPERGALVSDFLMASFPNPALGKEWRLRAFNPITLRLERVRAWVRRREALTGGPLSRSFLVQVGQGAQRTLIWVDAKGRVLQQKALGLTFVTEAGGPGPLASARDGGSDWPPAALPFLPSAFRPEGLRRVLSAEDAPAPPDAPTPASRKSEREGS